MREVKHQHCNLLESRHESLSFNEHTDRTAFELPDKNRIIFGKELFIAPEVYFSEKSEDGFKGIHNLIGQSL
jgi:Actin